MCIVELNEAAAVYHKLLHILLGFVVNFLTYCNLQRGAWENVLPSQQPLCERTGPLVWQNFWPLNGGIVFVFSCVRVNLYCSQVEICIILKVSDILLTPGVVHEKYINKIVVGIKSATCFFINLYMDY